MRGVRGLLVALALVLVLAWAGPAAAAPLPGASVSTLADYRARVEAADEYAARTLPGAWKDERTSQEAAAQLNTYLPGAERVLVGTRTVNIDNSILRSLVARLDSSKVASDRRETGEDIVAHLGSLRLAVEEAGTGATPDPALLARLLARPDLSSRPTLSDAIARQLDRLVRWLQDWFARVMRRRGAVAASDAALGVVFVVLAVLLTAALVQVIRSVSAALARHDTRVLAERAADAAAVVAAAEGLPLDALAYAEDLAASGRFREAVRALFGGAARTLVDLGLLRSMRTRTNAELLADLAPAAPPVLPPLAELSAAFERAWYGHADPGEAGYAEARERYRASVRSAERVRAQRDAEEAAS